MADCNDSTLSVRFAGVPTEADSRVFSAIESLIDDVDVRTMEADPPEIPHVDIGVDVLDGVEPELEEPTRPDLGGAPFFSSTEPKLTQALYNAVTDLIDFTFESPLVPSIEYGEGKEHLSVPDRQVSAPPTDFPEEEQLELPLEPDIDTVPAPELTPGERPELTSISMESYNVAPLDPVSIDMSEIMQGLGDLEMPDVETVVDPEYDPYRDDAPLVGKVKDLLRGSGDLERWVSTEVQRLLNEADTRRQPAELKRATDEVFREAAARNFALPAGFVDEQVALLSEEDASQRFDRAHEIQQEIYEQAIGAVADAATRSIQIERYLFSEYVSYVRRAIEAYRINIGIAQAAYNALVEIFNTARQVVESQVQAYRQYVQAQTDQNQALGMQADLTQAQIENYQTHVQMFRSDVDLLQASARVQEVDAEQQTIPLDVFESTLRGTLANLNIVRQNIQAYRQAIDNYSQATDWFSDALGSYEAAVQAETSNVSVTEENLRAYSQLWSAESSRISDYQSYVQDSVQTMDAELSRYQNAASEQRNYLQSVTGALQDTVMASEAWQGLIQQNSRVTQAYNSAQTSFTSATDQTDLAKEDLRIVQRSLDESAKAEEMRLQAARESVTVRAAGALSQAASSVYQVNLSGNASVSDSVDGTVQYAQSSSMTNRRSWQNQCVSEARALRG